MSAHVPGERWHADGGIVKGDRADMYPPLFEATPGTDDGAIALAAAAPEMLDALLAIRDAHERGGIHMYDAIPVALGKVRAAIAKAVQS